MRSTLKLIPLLLLGVGCLEKGDDGDDGATGADGADGADGAAGADAEDGAVGDDGAVGEDAEDGVGFDFWMAGTVSDGVATVGDVPVMLFLVDDDSGEVAQLGVTFTDADGLYAISLADFDAANMQLLTVAYTPTGDLMAYGHSDDITLSPASTAVSEVMSWIVGSEDGRSLSDFDAAAYTTLIADADAALATAGTDLSDLDAVVDQVLVDLGGDIADASGGTYSASTAELPFSVEGAGVQVAASGSYAYLYDGLGYYWDIYTYYGYVSDGGSDPYDSHGYLYVDGDTFYTGTSSYFMEDDYEVVIGPDTISDLDISRKIYVSPTDGFIRNVEIFENNTAADITTDIYIYGDMGPGSTTDADYTSSGDDVLDASDGWVVSSNDSDGSTTRETIAWAVPGATDFMVENGDQIYAYFDATTIPAGDRVTITHWNFQRDPDGEADLAAEMQTDFTTDGVAIDGAYYADMTFAEYFDNIVALVTENIVGEAGSVAPFAVVTVENATQSITVDATASSDGSFSMGIPADSGDTLNITATDGTSDTVTVP